MVAATGAGAEGEMGTVEEGNGASVGTWEDGEAAAAVAVAVEVG